MSQNRDPHHTIAWNAFPALLFACALSAGIGVATWVPVVSFGGWVSGVVGTGAVAILTQVRRQTTLLSLRPLVAQTMMLAAGLCMGGALYTSHQSVSSRHLVHQVQEKASQPKVWIEGRITDEPVVRPNGTRFTLATNQYAAGSDTLLVEGKVSVFLGTSRFVHTGVYPRLQPGDLVQLEGKVQRIVGPRNPADFDYATYQSRRGVWLSMSLYNPNDVVVAGHAPSLLHQVITPARAAVRAHIQRCVADEQAQAIVQALLLGDRRALPSETRAQFARTGLAHLLAVSGLHIMLVGLLFYRLLGPFLVRLRGIGLRLSWATREWIRALLTVVVLLCYLLMAGASASAFRAVIMAVLLLGGAVLQRTAHPLNTLGVAALVLLCLRPAQLFEAGFQLSFAAVGAIVLLVPVLNGVLPAVWIKRGWRRKVATMTTVSLAASLGTMPVLLYHFGQASFAGLLLNLLAIPATALTLSAALLLVILAPFPSLAAVLGASANWLAQFLLLLTQAGDAYLGGLNIVFHMVDSLWIIGCTGGLVALAQWSRPRLRWRFALIALFCAVLHVWINVWTGASAPGLQVVFFDVGHGDAALVTLPNGAHVLIDTGERSAFSDQGTRTIVPHLQRFGIDRLDAVVISHPHGDHLGGLPSLLRTVPVGRVLHNGQTYDSDLFRETVALLDSLHIPSQAVGAGDTLLLDPSVRIYALGPSDPTTTDANEASVVLRMVYNQTSFLFTGDAEAMAEHALVETYGPLLQSDVVKVGHHGSRTSSTAAFVHHAAATSPTLAVISVGPSSRFGLPDEEVVRRWEQEGATVWSTAWNGALWLQSDGQMVTQVAWR